MLLEVINLEVQRKADDRRGEFMVRVMRTMENRPSVRAYELMVWFLKHKIKSPTRLRKLANETRDSVLWGLIIRYENLRERIGYYPSDGSGGPRFLRDMTDQEISAIYVKLTEVVPALNREVAIATNVLNQRYRLTGRYRSHP